MPFRSSINLKLNCFHLLPFQRPPKKLLILDHFKKMILLKFENYFKCFIKNVVFWQPFVVCFNGSIYWLFIGTIEKQTNVFFFIFPPKAIDTIIINDRLCLTCKIFVWNDVISCKYTVHTSSAVIVYNHYSLAIGKSEARHMK